MSELKIGDIVEFNIEEIRKDEFVGKKDDVEFLLPKSLSELKENENVIGKKVKAKIKEVKENFIVVDRKAYLKEEDTLDSLKNKKLNLTILIFGLLVICGGLCFITGCFVSNKNITKNDNYQEHQNMTKFKYKHFVNAWNKILLNNQYFVTFNTNKLLLPNTNDKEVIDKLNQIFNPTRIKTQIEKYKKTMTDNELLNIPIQEYINFLQKLNFKKNRFNKDLSDKEIEKLVLFMINSDYNYLTFKTIQQLTWTYSFKNYFKDNIKMFIKKGFSRNLENYEKYKSIINLD